MKRILFLTLILWTATVSAQRIVDLSSMQIPTSAPNIVVVNSMTSFTTTAGTASASQFYTFTGTNILSDGTVTALTNFEVSLNNSTWSSTTLNVPATGGIFTGQPITIYVRVRSSATAGNYSGNVTVASSGATTRNVPVSAVVNAPGTVHFRAVTIPLTSVPSNQTNFTFTFNGTYSFLKNLANGGSCYGRNDIHFAANSSGSTPLKYHIERYDSTTGVTTGWIKVPALSSTVDNVIYLIYGNSSATNGEDAPNTYDANAAAVWHMNNSIVSAGQTMPDVTSNALNLTSAGTWTGSQQVAGVAGGSINLLNANGNYFTFSGYLAANYTLEAWVKISVADATSVVFGVSGSGSSTNFFQTQFRLYGGFGDLIVDQTPTPVNTWTYLAFSINGAAISVYHNGVQTTSNTNGAGVNFNQLGRTSTTASANISFDEIRISSVGRSSDWIGMVYANMNNPAGWYTVGAEN